MSSASLTPILVVCEWFHNLKLWRPGEETKVFSSFMKMVVIHLVLLMTCTLMSSTDATEGRNISTEEAVIKNETDSGHIEIIKPDEAVIKNETDSGHIEIIKPNEAVIKNETDSGRIEIIQPDNVVIKNETDKADIKNETDSGRIEIIKPGEAVINNETDPEVVKIIQPDEAVNKNETDAASTKVIETGEAAIKGKTDAACSCPNILQSYQFDEEAVILKLKFAMSSFQEDNTMKSALHVLSQIVTRVKKASDSIKALTSRLDNLQATVNGVKAKADSLSPLTSTINTLHADVVDLKANSGEVRDLKQTVRTLVQKVDTMNASIGHLDQHIYFMATFKTLSSKVEPGHVVFDEVLTNTGDAYNATTGVFTAPVDGVYVFSAQSFSLSSTDANWDFHANGKLVLRSRLVTTTDTSHNYVVPVTLQVGGQVYVNNRNALKIYGINHSFFSGWLIKAF